MRELARIALVSSLAIVLLSGCSTWRSAINYIRADSATSCPDVAILANTASLPAFDPATGADPSTVLYTVAMTGVSSRCDFVKRTSRADTNMKISVTATRAPGGEEAHYRVPYYIAVTSEGEIIDKQNYWMEFEFPQGVSTVTFKEEVDSVEVQVERQKKPYEYHLLLGFQLTKAQLEYTKKMGQYAP
jgi:hypothetical protein